MNSLEIMFLKVEETGDINLEEKKPHQFLQIFKGMSLI